MVLQHKLNYLIINKMKSNMNFAKMSYSELVAMKDDLLLAINAKREEEMKRALEALMQDFSATKEEMIALFCGDGKETLALPEPAEETPIVEAVPINPDPKDVKIEDVWNHPALKAPYIAQAATKKTVTPSTEESLVKKAEENIPSMADLLSNVPEYKAIYTPKSPVKKNNRKLPTMDELLSGDPINKILCLGNEKPKGSPYRQHTRINHVDGIIPTETATGQTLVYIPPKSPLSA